MNSGDTSLNLTSLSGEEIYSIFVVASSDTNTLPSPHSALATVTPGVSISFSSSGSNVEGSTDFSFTCVVSVSVSVTSLNVTLLDSTNTVRNSTLFISLSAGSFPTVNVIFGTLSTSDAGQYSCVGSAIDNNGSATVSGMGNVAGNTVHHADSFY